MIKHDGKKKLTNLALRNDRFFQCVKCASETHGMNKFNRFNGFLILVARLNFSIAFLISLDHSSLQHHTFSGGGGHPSFALQKQDVQNLDDAWVTHQQLLQVRSSGVFFTNGVSQFFAKHGLRVVWAADVATKLLEADVFLRVQALSRGLAKWRKHSSRNHLVRPGAAKLKWDCD